MEHVTEELFRARIIPLLTDARALPKRALDRHLLLISALAGLSPTESYSEGAINAHLERWLRGAGSHLPLDHVTLRRLLVDVGLLVRDSAGRSYRVQAVGSQVSFDPALLALDVAALVAAAEDDRAARKQRHQAGTVGG